jgi:antitoxin component YwqK of YwqJK toxin-antitoxin module
MVEYGEDGEIITQGEYIEGYEEGKWVFKVGDARIEGNYGEGMRNGEWKYIWSPSMGIQETVRYEGKFVEDNPHGKHTWYWDNGKKKDEGEYVMGLKEGDWISFNYDGTPFIVVSYKGGKEVKYDGIKIPDNETN